MFLTFTFEILGFLDRIFCSSAVVFLETRSEVKLKGASED